MDQFADVEISREKRRLWKRSGLVEARVERLAKAAHAYEKATESNPTPEQEARLNRLIAVANWAHDMAQDLDDRAQLLGKAVSALEDAYLITCKRRNARRRARNSRKALNTSA